jgi:hypothetical protein
VAPSIAADPQHFEQQMRELKALHEKQRFEEYTSQKPKGYGLILLSCSCMLLLAVKGTFSFTPNKLQITRFS